MTSAPERDEVNAEPPWILSLREAAGAPLGLVGGKAARIGRLATTGLPVPDGFVVTTAAYRLHADHPSIRRHVEALDRPRGDALEELKESARRIRGAITAREIPGEVRRAVRSASRSPPAYGYAVRSSAPAEDRREASFAGQHDTVLGVEGGAPLLAAIRSCWASLYTERAVSYRAAGRAGATAETRPLASMAVLVQAMVPAEASGVLFTADPIGGNRRVAVVEATFGLGEPLVGGEVEGDRVRVDRRSGTVLSYETAEKRAKVRALKNRGVGSVPLPADRRHIRVLDDERLRALVGLGDEIEALFGGRPQDIEWSLAEGRFHLLQARPVTALPPLPEPVPSDGRLHFYVNMGAMQAVAEPMPPLVRDVWIRLLEGAIELTGLDALTERWCAEAGGRVWFDLTPIMRIPALRSRLAARLGEVSEPVAEGLRALFEHHPDAFRGGGPSVWKLSRALGSGGATVLAQLPRLAWGFVSAFLGKPPDLDAERRYYEAWGRSLADSYREPADLAERTRRALGPVKHMREMRGIFPRLLGLSAAFFSAALLERRFPEDREEVEAAGRGFPREIVTRMTQELGDVADVARSHPEVAEALRNREPLEEVYGVGGGDRFREAFESYLENFGHRATGEIDLSNPRWCEDPGSLLEIVRANLARGPAADHREHLQRLVREREAAGRSLERRSGDGPAGPLKKALVRRLLRTYRGYLPIRELPKHGLGHLFTALRKTFLEAGARLVEMGVLERSEDVWFLRGDELSASLEDGLPVEVDLEARRAEHERHRQTDPPAAVTSEGEDPRARAERARRRPGTLRGTGVSAGVVEGPVRVVRDPATSTVEPGEILVAPSCGPGWTPLFLNAAGLVAEVGGRISHGALVAREYGLPAVVSVAGATRTLRTGQRIRVDGIRGVVEVLDEDPTDPERPGGESGVSSEVEDGP